MILERLRLQNVRSFKDAVIDFPLGKTLFEGDIGSGKSTILMAIEFALFGLGDEKPGALLRAGESESNVELTFDVNGKKYTVTRSLQKKGKSIQQSEGTLKSEDGVQFLSPSELKERILEILNFNEPPNPNAQSVIYRYAVFTPQEEMKEILGLPAASRLQTLRKAFGLEDYRTAGENAKEVARVIGRRASQLEGATSDVPALKKNVEEISKEIDAKKEEQGRLDHLKNEINERLETLEDERKNLSSKMERLAKASSDVSHLGEQLRSKKIEAKAYRDDSQKLNERLALIKRGVSELRKAEDPTELSQSRLEREIDRHEKLERQARNVKVRLESRLEEYAKVMRTGVCPTCDTRVDPKRFSARIRSRSQERKEAASKVDRIVKHLGELKKLLKKKRIFDDQKKDLKGVLEKETEYADQLSEVKRKHELAEEEMEKLERQLVLTTEQLRTLEGVGKEFEELERRVKESRLRLQELTRTSAQAEQAVNDRRAEVSRLNVQITKKESYSKKAEKLKDYQIWIEDYFLPTVDSIEKHVMSSINQEFNVQFQECFGTLLEDSGKEARIDEEFTPIAEQDGYEQDVRYLSGGERTSVALAYRLALNTVVQKVSAAMQSNLLILDEPTEGFSKEQLGKVGEILDELHRSQVIIVSHERELESFADQIFRIVKNNGESSVLGSSRGIADFGLQRVES